MEKSQFVDELSSKLKDLFARGGAGEVDKNLRAIVQSAFTKLELVTREEFEVQQEVLLRTRNKLAELEAKLALLEASSAPPANGTPGERA